VTDTPVTDSPADGPVDDLDELDEEMADEAAEDDADDDPSPASGEALLVREGDIAGDYLERLLDIVDYDGDIDLDVEGDRAVVAVIGDGLQGLIGPNGATLEALQELTRLAVQQQTGSRSRLMLDIGGYRARRRAALADIARSAAAEVAAGGTPVRLDAMNPFERKVVHDAIALVDGVHSESEGEEPDRRVVVLPD
jgi:spoIIIJ-associated protein